MKIVSILEELSNKQNINEEFDEPVETNVLENDNKQYHVLFSIDENKYSIRIYRKYLHRKEIADVQFVMKMGKGYTPKMTGSGHVKKVFSTIINTVKDFIDKNKPDYLVFDAINTDESRVKFYRMLIFSKELREKFTGYIPGEIFKEGDYTFYTVKKRGLPDLNYRQVSYATKDKK